MSSRDIAFERVQALLKVDTGSGSLYDHLVKVVRKLAEDKPGDALAQVESLSRHVKLSTFRGSKSQDEALDIVTDAPADELVKKWCDDMLKAMRPPESLPPVLCAVQNFLEDSQMFEWAGVGFGRQESFNIQLSLRRLAAETQNLDKLRFWGKVLGTEADYYVAEGSWKKERPPEGADPPEPTKVIPGTPEYDVENGEGVNAKCYWVNNGGSTPWVRLPAARAGYIKAARKICRVLTGNLASPVNSCPWFPGKERHLLRAQIARIGATCTLAPAGLFEEDAALGGKNIMMVEAPAEAFPSHEDLARAGSWVHIMPHILTSNARTSYPDLEGLEVELSEELKNEFEEEKAKEEEHGNLEPIEGDLADLKTDDDPEGSSPAWNIKVFGDQGIYTIGGAEKSYRVTAVRSQLWPGAVSAAQGTKFANIYVGYGVKEGKIVGKNKETGLPLPGTSPFSPLAPGDICDEPAEPEEQEEPTQQDEEESVGDKSHESEAEEA